AAGAKLWLDDRVWYDQFTSTDWVHDSIADAFRVKALRSRKDFKGRLQAHLDGAQGWVIVAVIGVITAGFAYSSTLFDFKSGFCAEAWWHSKRSCCRGATTCAGWVRWSSWLRPDGSEERWWDFVAFVGWVVGLSLLSCLVTLQTKTTISSAISLSTLDENLGAEHHSRGERDGKEARGGETAARHVLPGGRSGVAEVKVILSGFVLHGYLGVRTLVFKTIGLILSVASGLSIGKEGPYVHIATCVGNIACRLFDKYRLNDGKRREVLSASAAAGVAVAFGAPIGGVLFSLEEVSYYFPPKTLFRTFFCCIAAALSLKALNPYGTGKIVLFEIRYLTDWQFFELFAFILCGILGGAAGALFIKASRFWAKTFRKMTVIKKYPIVEVLLVAVLTGLISFWNRYTRLPVAELLFELCAPCDAFTETGESLCPTVERIPGIIWYLGIAFIVKTLLTVVTFGVKVPAGIYVPSMVVGGLLGRIVGHTVQYLTLRYPAFPLFASCPADGAPESCVVPGVYALVAAGATMCGVTRLSVTLAVILFELTGSLEHVLPFSLGVLVAKWTADALEPLSIYDLLTDMNAYPFLDAKARPVFTSDLGDITMEPSEQRYIDISASPLVEARVLRRKLEYLHMAGELDGGLPILRDGILVGLIPAPDLEFALDRLEDEDGAMCFMSPQDRPPGAPPHTTTMFDLGDDDSTTRAFVEAEDAEDSDGPLRRHARADPTDFTPYIDPAPVCLDVCSPMDLVFECFVKLGLRLICVVREGRFVGLVHKKAFVRYVKEVEEGERRG
ncbi:Chromatin organization modifier domain, partial [Teratosphaeria destructans]